MSDRDQRFSEGDEEFQENVSETLANTPPLPQKKILERVKTKFGKLHLFAAFCENPTNVTFDTQEDSEHVLLFLRKSQWVNTPWIITSIVLALIPLLAYNNQQLLASFLPPLNVILILLPLYYLVVATYAFVNFVTWYYNVAIISDKRIIDIDFHQIVLKDVAETKLALVQDVSYKQTGVLPNIFGYGFVLIQTAGTLDNFEFHNLPQPSRVVEITEELIGGKRLYEP